MNIKIQEKACIGGCQTSFDSAGKGYGRSNSSSGGSIKLKVVVVIVVVEAIGGEKGGGGRCMIRREVVVVRSYSFVSTMVVRSIVLK